jgi:hypothetical protein
VEFLGKRTKGGSALPMMDRCTVLLQAIDTYCPSLPAWSMFPRERFHMGPSDEDIAYAFSARNKSVFHQWFLDGCTEITNNEYRQFVFWVRDSVVAKKDRLCKIRQGRQRFVDQAKMRTLKWDDPKTIELLGQSDILLSPDDRIFGKKRSTLQRSFTRLKGLT